MNHYEQKKQARIERLRKRAEAKQDFAKNNGLDLYGEAKSGIPLGQPILVGHHSEHRHRRHLERIENKVRKGFEAANEAERLSERADAAESRTDIDSDNPAAVAMLETKVMALSKQLEEYRLINRLIKQTDKNPSLLAMELKNSLNISEEEALDYAYDLLTPDFMGRIGIPDYKISNLATNLRRYKLRLEQQKVISQGFEAFTINEIKVECIDGQIRVHFPSKPNEASRSVLKRSPLVLKWSSYSKAWVRKHTAATASRYFKTELQKALEVVVYE